MDKGAAKTILCPPPVRQDGAPMSIPSAAVLAELARKSTELRLACAALSQSELREWLQTKHGRQIANDILAIVRSSSASKNRMAAASLNQLLKYRHAASQLGRGSIRTLSQW
jgi:hypothetical protein